MAIDKTIPIGGIIAPNSEFDTYPVTDPKYGLGGLKTVHSVADLSLIPSERRQEGMVVYVSAGATPNYYSYIDSTWVLLDSLSSFGGKWNSTYTSVCATSANWDEVYTAVTTYSASWNEGGTGASVDLSALAAASGNWNSTYTSVCATSANWDSTYTTVYTNSASWATAAENLSGNNINLGVPEDGSLVDGAYLGWTPFRKVTDAVDDLNELVNNIFRSTFVKAVNFTADNTAGGQGLNVTLTVNTTGSTPGASRRYDIDWGDGSFTLGTTDSTPSYTYNSNTGSPFTVSVSAYNTDSWGAGSIATVTREGYIIIYTTNPDPRFDLYRNESSGGTILAGNNLWVTTSDTLYLKNTTLYTQNNTQNPRYTIYWNYPSDSTNVIGNGVAGGALVTDARLSKVYSTSSTTGTYPVRLAVTRYDSANPVLFPPTQPLGILSTATNLKVYDPAIAAPAGLSTKSITWNGGGSSQNLAYNYTDNVLGGSSRTAGSSQTRITTNDGSYVESTEAGSAGTGQLTYNGSGSTVLSAAVNGYKDGEITLTGSVPANTRNNALVVTQNSDFNLFNSSGVGIAFASSIYYPTLYYGFKAKVSKLASSIPVGVNSFQLKHSTTGDTTNTLYFVKDDVTTTPSVDVSTGPSTVTEGTAGTYTYISGVPYYSATGSPAIVLNTLKLYDWIGQTYTSTNPLEISAGSAQQGTGSIISTVTRTYSQVDSTPTFLYTPGNIPYANTGKDSSNKYTISNQTVNIASGVFAAANVRVRAANVNGYGSYSTLTDKLIHVCSTTPTGFREDSISCNVASNTTPAIRLYTGWTGYKPVYTVATNFVGVSAWSGAEIVAGTDEAIVYFGQLKHFTTNLNSGYLPQGPNLSTGRSGLQYFRGAFKRTSGANFNFSINGRLSNFFIAAPGLATDSSTENGWLSGTSLYPGGGTPGANGNNGCAVSTAIPRNTVINSTYQLTLGEANLSTSYQANNTYGGHLLFTIELNSSDYINSLSITEVT